MHYGLYVTTNAGSKEDALAQVKAWLDTQELEYTDTPTEDDPEAYTKKGFLDWYVIGGRWALDLANGYEWTKGYWELCKVLKEKHNLDYFYTPTTSVQEGIYHELGIYWHEHCKPPFANNVHPMKTGQYKENGYDGDVLQIDAEIYDYAVLPYVEKKHQDEWGNYYFFDLQGDSPSDKEKYLSKWIVIVDYHN